MKLCLLAAILIGGVLGSVEDARASRFITGAQVLEYCRVQQQLADPDSFLEVTRSNTSATLFGGYCMGLMQGVRQTAAAYQTKLGQRIICPPPDLTNDVMAGLTVRYLELDESRLQEPAGLAVLNMLTIAFPCTDEN